MCVRCTWMPEVVKYGISNLTLIGGFPSLSSASTLGRPKWARIKYSFPPCDTTQVTTQTLYTTLESACAKSSFYEHQLWNKCRNWHRGRKTATQILILVLAKNTNISQFLTIFMILMSHNFCSQGRTWSTRRSRCSQAPTWRCPLWSWIWVSQHPLALECGSPRCWLWNASWTDSSPERRNKQVKFNTMFRLNMVLTLNDIFNYSIKKVWCVRTRHTIKRRTKSLKIIIIDCSYVKWFFTCSVMNNYDTVFMKTTTMLR